MPVKGGSKHDSFSQESWAIEIFHLNEEEKLFIEQFSLESRLLLCDPKLRVDFN